MKPTHRIISYRKGMNMREDHVFNWLEADELFEELMRSNMYDEVRVIKIEDDKNDVHV